MTPRTETRFLQAFVALACLIPIVAGAAGLIESAAMLRGVDPPVPPDLDSHYRYLSGLLLGIGIGFAACVPRIERKSASFRMLGGIVIVGGLGRLLSLLETGAPSRDHQLALAMEIGAIPLLILWQARVARRCREATSQMS